MTSYQAEMDGAMVAFASTVPGEIVPVDLRQYRGFYCQKGSFLCAESMVETKVAFTKKVSSGFFGGEGFILQEMQGNGMVFLEVDGNKVEKELLRERLSRWIPEMWWDLSPVYSTRSRW